MNLSAWMAADGLTNAALAAKLGVAENTVNRWRNGWRRPRGKVMALIHELSAGKVTPNDFFALQEEPRAATKRAVPAAGKHDSSQRRSAPAAPRQRAGVTQ